MWIRKNLELVDKFKEVKHLLEEFETEKAIGAMVRSRVRWYEEGKKSRKFFFRLEKTQVYLKTYSEITYK